MNKDQLHKVAVAMVAPGKGHPRRRREHRHDPEALRCHHGREQRGQPARPIASSCSARRRRWPEHISGVILYDETIRQKAKDGTPLVKLIEQAGSIPGIKVDKSAHPMPMFPGETITEGLDGLPKRIEGVLRARRPLREMARGDRDRRGRPAHRGIGAGQHAGAGALRRDLPGGRYRADRRARSADGRRAHHRAELRRDALRAQHPLRRALSAPRLAGGGPSSSRTWSCRARTPPRPRPSRWPNGR